MDVIDDLPREPPPGVDWIRWELAHDLLADHRAGPDGFCVAPRCRAENEMYECPSAQLARVALAAHLLERHQRASGAVGKYGMHPDFLGLNGLLPRTPGADARGVDGGGTGGRQAYPGVGAESHGTPPSTWRSCSTDCWDAT